MPKVYIIDDDHIMQKMMQKMIEKFDGSIIVECYSDGEQGLDALTKAEDFPDLIFLDINMPVIDGWKFIELYKEYDIPQIPIHILTSSIDGRDIKKANDISLVLGYQVKPLRRDNLAQILASHLDK